MTLTKTLSIEVDELDECAILNAIAVFQRRDHRAFGETLIPEGESDLRGAILGEICRGYLESVAMSEGMNEPQLIHAARLTLSGARWALGSIAVEWMKRFSRGRSESELADHIGVPAQELEVCRTVFIKFADVKDNFPKLFWPHFKAALEWDDSKENLTWANDVEANVAEMKAWRRANRGEDLSGE